MSSEPITLSDLAGNFHAHITVRVDDGKEVVPPAGWKTTIIVLNKDDRQQKDVMITRHFKTGTDKTPDVSNIVTSVEMAVYVLECRGYEVIRGKLEHESLPTFAPSVEHYREAHVKVKVPNGVTLNTIPGYVQSRNPMVTHDDYQVVFLNSRYYDASVRLVDHDVDQCVAEIQRINPDCEIVEVKKETTVFDSNHDLDKWWA